MASRVKRAGAENAKSPPPPARILVVDDEPVLRATLAEALASAGHAVVEAGTAAEALPFADQSAGIDLMLCDVQLPDRDGVSLLEPFLRRSPDTFAVLMTAYGSLESAIAGFQAGAHDYLLKPLHFDEVLAKVEKLLGYRAWRRENQWLRRELNRAFDSSQIIGIKSTLAEVFSLASKVAPTQSTVLIVGESGTGKELLARWLHQHGPYPDEKFIAINCAALPNEILENQLFGHRRGAFTGADRDAEGLFVSVGAGTLFLDEIGEMSPGMQAKLLRAIEQKEILPLGASEPVRVWARILAATNKDMPTEIRALRFREDLYYRLNVVSLTLPPLRDRREDIPELVDFLIAKQARLLGKRVVGIESAALRLLRGATWRGNVRELENVLQRAVILAEGPLLTPGDLPPDLRPDEDAILSDDLREAVAAFERRHIRRILREHKDKKEAARRLGLALSSLYRKIDELGIAPVAADAEAWAAPS
ncbi:MAG TPA: sigma-54 dependent transcriptional regulator [Gemmatales bacterium]|nr:sigma-54 dependent transcriptional regulator [Gemmatales bacterium]